MAHDHAALRKPAVVDRRPAVTATVQCSAAGGTSLSPFQALQQRAGTQARLAAAPTTVSVSAPVGMQFAKVSQPHDPAELEAKNTARKVVQMGEPARPKPEEPAKKPEELVKKKPEEQTKKPVQRTAASERPAPAGASVAPLGGSPLPPSVRGYMEPRFGADFSNVRIHTGEPAAQQSAALNAHAFTVGEHVFFGRNQYQPESAGGRELIAHELTHTIQQGAAIQRSADVTVTQHSEPQVQRLGLDDALNYFADKANYIPGFRLLTVVLGMNPINQAPVERSAANVLRGLLELIPVTGALISQALDSYGIFAKVGAWIEGQIRTLGMVGSALKGALSKFLDTLSWRDIFDLGGVWERGKRIFTEPIDKLIAFGKSLATDILRFIREAILLPLAKLAEGTRGYDLLKAVLGEDPVTGQPVARTPENLLGGFLKLIGQEDIWENMKKANAIGRAFAWFQSALAGLMGFVRQIPALFIQGLKSLEIIDLVLPPKAFIKLAGVFGNFVVQFITWGANAAWNLLEIIFDVVSPGALMYIKKTGAALKSILKNPLPFVGNLVKAAKQGFLNFADHFLEHLKAGLIDWLTGSLPGIYIPKAFSLVEIAKFAFSVLGLTWANIRQKLVKAVGETAVKAMETGFDIVVTLVRDGPAAAWDKIKEQLGNLKDMVIGGITDFVVDMVVKKAIPKLIAMFIPGAGFISAILSIYDTIMVFVNKISKIIQVVTGFIDSIVAIAGGAIGAAANKVESILANLLSLAINFLAGFAGLGKVADKVMAVIEKIRAPIDKALDWLINWIVTMAKTLFAKGKAAASGAIAALKDFLFPKLPFTGGGESHTLTVDASKPTPEIVVQTNPQPVAQYLYRLKPMIEEIPDKNDKAKAQKIYDKALEQRTKAADTLAMVLDPKTGKTKAEQDLARESQKLLEHIQNIWELLGSKDDLLPKEAEVDEYGNLAAEPDQTAHHVPQNGVLNRMRAWLNAYLQRPEVDDYRKNVNQKLAGLGVKYTNLSGYGMTQGISIRMQKIKHNRTRTFGKLPENLEIPQGEFKGPASVQARKIGDERMERFVQLVRAEFQQDIEDVTAIYGGQKGVKKVQNYQKVTAGIAKLKSQNRDKWGNFLG